MYRIRTKTQFLVAGWAATILPACSGSASSGLEMPPSPSASVITTPADAGTSAAYASDGSADTQADSPAPGNPLRDRDDVTHDGGLGRAATAAGDDAAGNGDASPDAIAQTSSDGAAAPAACAVAFTVTNAIVDGLYFKNVVLGGDAPALGGWDPAQVITMAQSTSVGVYTVTTSLAQGAIVHFKFGMSSSTGAVTWESAPANTDRELLIDCADAAGVSYVGQYNAVPDAGM